ncbi:uncharacterized protein GGS22DRAFT_57488 [Annulohypoxylon maeteangense]|uniref:uncharacterized protein n=1 Tax=Annulohypoxylon maeteangense TaxID=1927788 RepID=UPI002008A095|nr:uncharacterized protein GGS22DRAFT_57488 [Annulohypoxylon maeteangense]KAI0881837.1 hypothetical protein GGS22DRAFT_57488 [Annulohypoxylon maeteangense]
MSSIFPVFCTAELPIATIEKLLSDSLEGAKKMAPSEPSLAVVTKADNMSHTTASTPPFQPFDSPFIGQSVKEISRQFPQAHHFAVLDERSLGEKTVVLVELSSPDNVQTVRVTFGSAQSVLLALNLATLGFKDIQSIAASNGGVYDLISGSPKKGQSAPRKRLGADS